MLEYIHSTRSNIGLKRQAEFSDDLLDLNSELTKLGQKHPYNLVKNEYTALSKIKEYCFGASCPTMKTECDVEFLYRYTPLSRLTISDDWNDSIISKDKDEAFEIIQKKTSKNQWYQLSKVLGGFYKNPRGFSWWTDEIPNNISKLFKLGLVSDWFEEESVIMRTRLTKRLKQQINMPSVIDGYDQLIFLPRKKENMNSHGKTLNLNDLEFFNNGCKEYVITELNTNEIEIFPLKIDISPSNRLVRDSIQSNLLEFYKTKYHD